VFQESDDFLRLFPSTDGSRDKPGGVENGVQQAPKVGMNELASGMSEMIYTFVFD
jgi:hypothetical protein